jgi:predicted nuclease of predicted toxin-antitoxin system
MRFLVDEDLPRSVAPLIKSYGHEALDVRDLSLRGAKDQQIAAYAQSHQLTLVTGDFDFADIRNYPPKDFAGLVVLRLPRNATAGFILKLMDEFLQQSQVIARLPGRLAIVEPGRVRLRS